MDLSDLPLLVPISAFSDYIQCSICMTLLKNTHTTPCGHRYCEVCIKEWVDRQHKCPCCNHPVQGAQLIKDHQFDGLIACVLSEKDKSEQKYFESLLNQATCTESSDSINTGSKSPIETVLKKHLMHNLAAHENFSQELKKDFHSRQLKLEEETHKTVSELQNHGLSQEEVQSQTQDLQNTLERQRDTLTKELQSCLSLVATSYDKYLSSHIPSLDILPVKVSIYLLEKDIRIPNVHLRPKDSLSDIQAVLASHMEQINNRIVQMGDDVQWLIFGPFAKGNHWEMRTVSQEILEHGVSDVEGVSAITDQNMLAVQYSIKPNSEFVVCGTVKCHSDMPKQCFVKIFKIGEAKAVDYFSCKTCGFNWVCRSCQEVCHQGHTIVPYIMNHQPTWACCYCPKKKTCVIQDVERFV